MPLCFCLQIVEQDFVEARKSDPSQMTQEDFHSLLVVARWVRLLQMPSLKFFSRSMFLFGALTLIASTEYLTNLDKNALTPPEEATVSRTLVCLCCENGDDWCCVPFLPK